MCALYSAGSNACGQLGQGSDEDSHCFKRSIFEGVTNEELAGSKIISIAAGANHTLLILRSRQGVTQLWACGSGKRGQLGARYRREFGVSTIFRRIFPDRDETRYNEFTDTNITLIAASWETSFVVLSGSDNDVILSVGSDDFGDLGVGGLPGSQKETDIWRKVGVTHLLPRNASSIRISQLKAGPHTVLAKLLYQDANMREAQLIVGWGAARQGQLGQGRASKTQQAVHNSPKILRFPSHVDAFAVGNQHTIFLTSQGTVLAFGSNKKGQLSEISDAKNISAVGATWNGSYLLKKHDSVDKWTALATGSNSHCQLASTTDHDGNVFVNNLHEINLPADASGATSLNLTCGSEHVLVTSRNNSQDGVGVSIFGWGWNEHGNLALGHTIDIDKPTRIWPVPDHLQQGNIVGVWAGCATTWIAIEEE